MGSRDHTRHQKIHERCESFVQWADNVSKLSSLHGFVWYHRTESPFKKTLIFVGCICLMSALPAVMVWQTIEFYYDVRY